MRTLAGLLLILSAAFAGHEGTFVLENARVHTVSGEVLDPGTVVVVNGRIAAVGPAGEVDLPRDADVLDCRGKVLIPGLVDSHSHLGVYSRPSVVANSDGNEATDPVQSLVRAMDSIYPGDPGIRLARAGGVTTANVMPGSANVVGGQTAYVKLRGATVEEMLIDLAGGPGGLKMANGENPKRSYGRRDRAPATRMKVMALQRAVFEEARAYAEKRRRWEETREGDEPRRRPELEPLVEALQRKRTVHFHTHRADDVMSAMRLAREFGFELVLHHVTEAYLVADEIAKRGVACSHTIVDSPGGKPEAVHLRFDNPALAERAGVVVAINTDDPVTESRFFLRTAALCVRGGLPEKSALAAITLRPARLLHLDRRLGSIDKGKDADLVLLSGPPFSVYTRVLRTWIEGEQVFSRECEADLRWATGGYGVRERLRGRKRYAPAQPPQAAPLPDADAPRDTRDATFVLRAGVLSTAAGDSIPNGVVVVERGRIARAGRWGEVALPEGAPVFGAAWVTPGLIDAHASAGLSGALNVDADQDLDERTDPDQAALRVIDGFNPRERLVRYLLGKGVTLLHAVPGPRAVIAGRSGLFRTWADGEAAVVRFPVAMVFNLGEAPKRGRDKAPTTRMGVAAILRAALADAAQPPAKKNGDEPGPDLAREALVPVVAGELPALFVAHREDDLLTALRLGREFKLRVVLSQATEGYLVADRLREAGVPVLAAPTMQRAGDLQRLHTCLENAAMLADSGVPVAITSGYESYVPKTRVVLFEAAVAAANGLGWERALRAVTIEPARILGCEKDRGSIEPGKWADLVCYDGDPFEYVSHVVAVYGEGRLVHGGNT